MDEEFLYIDEAVEFLRCKKSRLRTACNKKQLPFYKNGAKIVFKKVDLISWLFGKKVEMKKKCDE